MARWFTVSRERLQRRLPETVILGVSWDVIAVGRGNQS